ncbi:MAG: DUF3788 family protein [Ruminococcaceae bacterium]|nr:DUF3788 family protein [Oscillospiraceae bacterium]
MKDQLAALLPEQTLSVWNRLTTAIDALYDVDRLWDKGFRDWKIEYKYRRGGKTLCTFYAREDTAVILITYGKAEREKFEGIRASLSISLQDLYDRTDTLHDGKWLWIPLDEQLSIEEILAMLRIKRRPNRK